MFSLYLKKTNLTTSELYLSAFRAIVDASEILVSHYEKDIEVVSKDDGSPVTVADIESANKIYSILSEVGLPIMSEEHEIPHFEERSKWQSYWCVDPLDGTKMFLSRNGEFAVNVALIENGKPVLGAIGDPLNRTILFGKPGYGAFLIPFDTFSDQTTWLPLSPAQHLNNPIRIICSRSYKHGSGFKFIQELEKQFGEVQFILKGSALKFFDLSNGEADLYTRFGPTMEWDIAAGDAILQSLNGTIVQIENNLPLRYNKESLYNPPFIAKTKAIIEA